MADLKTLINESGTQIVPRTTAGAVQVGGTTLDQTISSLAPLANPALTGVPTAPTAASGTNTTQIATTAFVQSTLNQAAYTISGTTLQLKLADGVQGTTIILA